jgi:hypothetical protein
VGAAIEVRGLARLRSVLLAAALSFGCVSQGNISPPRPSSAPTPPTPEPTTPPSPEPPVGSSPSQDGGAPDLVPDDAAVIVDAAPAEAAPLPPIADPVTRNDAAPPPPPSIDLARLLVVFLSVDEGTGLQLHDDSGLGQTAALHDVDPAAVWVDGRFGKALSLGGGSKGGYLTVDSAPSLISARVEMSVAAWLVLPPAASGTIVSRRAVGTGGYVYSMRMDSGHLTAAINSGNGYHGSVTSSAVVPAGRWVHVAMTFDTQTLKVYLDGEMVGAAEYRLSVAPATTPILVGAAEVETPARDAVAGVVDRLAAHVDDVLIYDRALPGVDVVRLAEGVRPVPVPVTPPAPDPVTRD